MFWNGQVCLKCLSPGVFDTNYKKCKCPANSQYYNETGACSTTTITTTNATTWPTINTTNNNEKNNGTN